MNTALDIEREAFDYNFNTMVSSFALPIAVVIVYRSAAIALKERSIIFKLNFIQTSLLLINTVVQMINVFYHTPNCRFPYFLYSILSYLSLLCVDVILYLKAYYINKSSKMIAVVCILLQIARLFFVIQSNRFLEFMPGQLESCRVSTNKWVLGVIGTEALVILFLCSLYLVRVYKQSKLTPNAVLTTVIRQGFMFPLAVCFTFIILASLLLADVAHGNTHQLLSICWVLNSWLVTKQMDFAHAVHQQDRASAVNLVNNKIALTQSGNHHDILSLASEDHSSSWDIYLGMPKAQTPTL